MKYLYFVWYCAKLGDGSGLVLSSRNLLQVLGSWKGELLLSWKHAPQGDLTPVEASPLESLPPDHSAESQKEGS